MHISKKMNQIQGTNKQLLELEGHRLEITYALLGKRSETTKIPESMLSKIPTSEIINVTNVPRAVFDKELAEDATEEDVKKFNEEKERFEAIHADDEQQVEVNLWIPVRKIKDVLMDGNRVRIFHTVRGPIMGVVLSEDTNNVYLYSPCILDPNVERGRIHYFPIAFAGFTLKLCKTYIGESVPQEAELRGYPTFVERNKKGDYSFRMKAAYNHFDADYPDDAKLVSADNHPRDALHGLIPTSDTREPALIEHAEKLSAVK